MKKYNEHIDPAMIKKEAAKVDPTNMTEQEINKSFDRFDKLRGKEIWYKIKVFEKGRFVDSYVLSYMTEQIGGRSKMFNDLEKDLERFAIDSGGFTTFTRLFAMAYDFKTGQIVFMMTYQPTLKYELITSKRKMQNELKLLDTKAKV